MSHSSTFNCCTFKLPDKFQLFYFQERILVPLPLKNLYKKNLKVIVYLFHCFVFYYKNYSAYSSKSSFFIMAKRKEPKPNPLISDLSLVESASRNYLVNGRRSLSNTERILRQDPSTSRELDRTGGLQPLLTRGFNQDEERHYLSRFVNYQTSLFIDRLREGNILRAPTLETLFEQPRENTNISISISTELESCCGEIKSKLDELLTVVQSEFRRLRALLTRGVASIQTEASKNYELLTDTSLESRALILNQLNQRSDTIEIIINQTNTFIQDKINERSDRLELILRNLLTTVLNFITSKSVEVIDQTKPLLLSLKVDIKDSFEALLLKIESSLTAQTVSLIASIKAFYKGQVLTLLSSIGAGVAEIVPSTTYISDIVTQILTEVKLLLLLLPKRFEELLEGRIKEFKGYLDEWEKELIKEVAEEVSLQIVGESYYRWDSVTTYFPTITFLFKEVGVSQYARKSQIKLRLSKRNEELTTLDIDNLKRSCNAILNSTYSYGTQRFNYVSSDKRFKTTVFGKNTPQIKKLLSSLFKVINDPFEEHNLSITSSRTRVNQTKRLLPLDTTEVNPITYKASFKVKFRKAVLLVHGLKSPIVLAEA